MKVRNWIIAAAFFLVGAGHLSHSHAQMRPDDSSYTEVNESLESITIPQGSSKRLKFAYDIPELMVGTPEVIQATPMRSDEIMISGLIPGHSSLTVSSPDKGLQTITVIVEIDTRPLDLAFKKHFPDSVIRVSALKQGIILTGFVTSPEQIDFATRVATDFFGDKGVVNSIKVQSSQNIAIQVKVYEVSRSKLRRMGVDWQLSSARAGFYSSVSGILQAGDAINGQGVGTGQDFAGGILRDSTRFQAFVQFLETRDVARLVDEPVLITKNGRPAEFLKGGEIPFQVSTGLGTNSIEFRPFGTKLDIVPMTQGNGILSLEVRAEVSEPSEELARGTDATVGFRVSRVNTGVDMRAGHTLALAGHYREKNANSGRGIPGLMDKPILGSAFRRVQDDFNESELLFLITPNYISDVEPNMLGTMPGQSTASPSDRELYLNAHNEVPRCNDDCPADRNFGRTVPQHQDSLGLPTSQRGNNDASAPVAREASNGFNWPGRR